MACIFCDEWGLSLVYAVFATFKQLGMHIQPPDAKHILSALWVCIVSAVATVKKSFKA